MKFAKWSPTSGVLLVAGILAIIFAAVPDGAHAQVGVNGCYPPPEIYQQPQGNTSIAQGQSTRLYVSANTVNVKWYRGVVGDRSNQVATTSIFDTPALFATTQYWAEVSTACGAVQSTQVTVTVANVTRNPGPCVTNATTACLLDGRFEVKIDFLNQFANPPQAGTLNAGKLVPGTQNPDTATFGFASAQAIEVVVRLQDTRPFGLTRFDVYYGGMTDVEYTVTVADTVTNTLRQYHNRPGQVGGGVDRTSFPTNGAATPGYAIFESDSQPRTGTVVANSPTGTCTTTANNVCLLSGRFQVRIDYLNQFANPPAPGTLLGEKFVAGVQNPDTGVFGFSSARAIEAVVRIQDTRPFGLNRFDVYFGGMTDVEYTVTVIDKTTGTTRTYRNPPNTVGGGVDRTSFVAN